MADSSIFPSTFFRLVSGIASLTLLSGCGTYYVSAANDFTSTAASLGPLVMQADTNQLKAKNDLKLLQISEDAKCPVASANIYIRKSSTKDTKPTANFIVGHPGIEAILQDVSGGNLAANCTQLKSCEENPEKEGCDTICYTAPEMGCLNQLLSLTSQTKNDGVNWNKPDLDYVLKSIQAVEYPETQVNKSKALSDALTYFSSYLDLLQTAATPQPTKFDKIMTSMGVNLSTSLKTDATNLASKVESARSGYNHTASKIDTTTIGGVSDTSLNTETNGLSALVATLNSIAQTDGSAAQIKVVVEKNKDKLNNEIQKIGNELSKEANKSFTEEGAASIALRKAYQEKFADAKNVTDRETILREMGNYPAPDQNQAQQTLLNTDVKKAVASIIEAHNTLVRMLDNPNKGDDIKKLNDSIQTISTLVAQISAIAAIYK